MAGKIKFKHKISNDNTHNIDNDQHIIKANELNKECNHDINDVNNTLSISNIRTLIYPPHKYAVCMYCEKPFEFIRQDNGEFVMIENTEEE